MKQERNRADPTKWVESGLRPKIYNEWTPVGILYDFGVPEATEKRADEAFEKLRPHMTESKLPEKRRDWQAIYHALERAAGIGKACVLFPRNSNHPDFRSIRLQLMSAAEAEGIVKAIKSPKGSQKMTRYVPLFKMPERTEFVELRERKTGRPLPVDFSHAVASDTQRKLTLVNDTNRNWKITIEPWDHWTKEYQQRRTIKPVHYAVFTDNFDLHGRIYTGRNGHQDHGKEARRTIRFGDLRSVELDYEGFHPRALYHKEGIRYTEDPYRLWGRETKPEQRLMAKQLINAAINAKTRQATVSACNQAMNSRTPEGHWKTGKERQQAATLRAAAKSTGLKFSVLYRLVARKHPLIQKYFGKDMGIRLMRMDSRIALEILYRFACRGVPCLSVHDSFIVPESEEAELRKLMIVLYRNEIGFDPIIK